MIIAIFQGIILISTIVLLVQIKSLFKNITIIQKIAIVLLIIAATMPIVTEFFKGFLQGLIELP